MASPEGGEKTKEIEMEFGIQALNHTLRRPCRLFFSLLLLLSLPPSVSSHASFLFLHTKNGKFFCTTMSFFSSPDAQNMPFGPGRVYCVNGIEDSSATSAHAKVGTPADTAECSSSSSRRPSPSHPKTCRTASSSSPPSSFPTCDALMGEEGEEEEDGMSFRKSPKCHPRDTTFIPLTSAEDCTRRPDSQEGLFAQYAALARYETGKIKRVFSAFHAGPGQVVAGSSHRHKVDCCLAMEDGEFVFLNYHSSRHHYSGHFRSCKRHVRNCLKGDSSDQKIAREEEEEERGVDFAGEGEEDFGEFIGRAAPPAAASSSSPPSRPVDENVDPDNVRERREKDSAFEKESLGKTASSLPRSRGDGLSQETSSVPWNEWNDEMEMEEAIEEENFLLDERTSRRNEQISLFCGYMTEAAAAAHAADSKFPLLRFRAEFVYECELFHGNKIEVGKHLEEETRGEPVKNLTFSSYTSLTKLLREKFPQDSILGLDLGKPNEEVLLRRLLTDDRLQGLVVFSGGFESRRDLASLQQGFCFGKFKCDTKEDPSSELGPFAAEVAAGQARFSSKKKSGPLAEISEKEKEREALLALKKKCKGRELTMTRLSFEPDQLTTTTVAHFRFLVGMRGLKGFRLHHFVYYPLRNYFFPLILKMLRLRHNLKRAGNDDLGCTIAKLFLNGRGGKSE